MNRLPWFPHEHDARDDDFIQAAEERFGHFGYSGWFKLLEILHQHGTGSELRMSIKRIARRMRSRPTTVRQLLDFCSTAGKLRWTEDGDLAIIVIEKVIVKWKNLKSKKISNGYQQDPKRIIEEEEEEEEDKQTSGDNAAPASSASPKRTTTAAPKRRAPAGFNTFMDEFLKEYLGLEPGKKGDDAMKARVGAAYRRFGRAGRDVFDSAGRDPKVAIHGLHEVAKRFEKRGLDWTLDTAAKHFPEWMADPKYYEKETRR